MINMNLPLLKSLSEAPGVPGREEKVRAILEREMKGLFDQVETDPMGNLIGSKKPTAKGKNGGGKPKRVLLACHIDEIGFYVRHVDDKGYLRIQNVGGFDTRTLLARRVRVQTPTVRNSSACLTPAGGRSTSLRKRTRRRSPRWSSSSWTCACRPSR